MLLCKATIAGNADTDALVVSESVTCVPRAYTSFEVYDAVAIINNMSCD